MAVSIYIPTNSIRGFPFLHLNQHLLFINFFCYWPFWRVGFPGGTVVRDKPVKARDEGETSLILGSGRSPELGDGNPLQCSCLENFMDWGAWWAPVSWGCKESDTTEHACTHSDWCDVMSHCSFAVPFSNKLVPLSIFSCASWPSIYLLCRNVYLGLQPIFDWVGFFFFFFLYWAA